MALVILLLATVSIRVYMSSLFPYLNDWDERFHALVGKNMIDHPFSPMLYKNALLPYDYTKWDENYIWLHKEPLFLWFIAISIKIFGVSELSVRIPSIIASCILVLLMYRLGKLYKNEQVGFFAALLMSSNLFVLQLCSGSMGMDHNDIHFLLFISLSIWSWIEWKNSHDWKWLIAIGLFSGAAILVKWLVGLLVYLFWGIHTFFIEKKFFTYLNLKNIVFSIFITFLTIAPWHIWIFTQFPKEASYEISTFSNNLSKSYDNSHFGTYSFYIDYLKTHYSYLHYFIFLGLLVGIFNKKKNLYLSSITVILLIYVFFSLVVHKSPNYVVIVFPFCFIFIASFINFIYEQLKLKSTFISKGYLFFIPILLVIINLRPIDINRFIHPDATCWWQGMRSRKIHNTKEFKLLKKQLNPKTDVVIFCNNTEEIEVMFYTDCIAYGPLDSTQVNTLLRLHKNLYAFNIKKLPSYVNTNNKIQAITFDYMTNEW